MIKAKCGCYLIAGKTPIIHLECHEHVGSEIYGDYDGKATEISNYLLDRENIMSWLYDNDEPYYNEIRFIRENGDWTLCETVIGKIILSQWGIK